MALKIVVLAPMATARISTMVAHAAGVRRIALAP